MILTKTGQQHGKSTAIVDHALFINVDVMNLFFLHTAKKDPEKKPGKPTLIFIPEPSQNTSDGSEFLDDAIRTVDQPLVYPEDYSAIYCW